ncbi:thiosulfate sulfurtransferase/rhodanese-like domain-containing protein 3 isoform X2 [Xenopus tropicalis]|uniref:Thiosulfate sulfurtransferase/rhodanese-like domain-containing protein 3 isoform X2 n=1 Tax=Xenopus tropicalis TaxID=8364 RepID=A0A8J0T316_XENTR|nr:thiosulfate sulfurtransferase/rhodanese-like domain-containing protein 3 isoform X2 [Xenopus tropicalis]|eukprot:XP_017949672.1 PREDICTED: thiosulfate sulfurtransferase/rhodanese-like domain-containing protein 3 isoform X2 [Xenopus tropicalis]
MMPLCVPKSGMSWLCFFVCSTISEQVHSSARSVARGFSSVPSQTIKYEELKDLLKEEGVVIIDVREPWEVKEYGVIKGSLSIPMGDLASALQLDPLTFEKKYQVKMPEKTSTLIFSCLAGIRSKKAVDVAGSLGFKRVHHYAGGFEDWARHETPEKKL